MTRGPVVRLDVDGPWHDPVDYARRLLSAAEARGDKPDSYGEGEAVRRAEDAVARALGKERAILFATGTLANLLALDRLCGPRARRVLVHPASHVHGDTGDASAAVAGLTTVVLPAKGAGFDAAALEAAVADAASGRVAQRVGAVVIETPVRRLRNAPFDADDLAGVVAAARRHGIGLHLDGARLPIGAAALGRSMAALSAPFDTVYLSLWKMLGLPFGAALAGDAALLDGIAHDRRRHGGALPQFWPLALLTEAGVGTLDTDWARVLAMLDAVVGEIDAEAPGLVGRAGVNTVWFAPRDPAAFRDAAVARGLVLGETDGARVLGRANVTWLATDARRIAGDLLAAARG